MTITITHTHPGSPNRMNLIVSDRTEVPPGRVSRSDPPVDKEAAPLDSSGASESSVSVFPSACPSISSD